MDLFLAGGETSATTLAWSVVHMVRHPDIQVTNVSTSSIQTVPYLCCLSQAALVTITGYCYLRGGYPFFFFFLSFFPFLLCARCTSSGYSLVLIFFYGWAIFDWYLLLSPSAELPFSVSHVFARPSVFSVFSCVSVFS